MKILCLYILAMVSVLVIAGCLPQDKLVSENSADNLSVESSDEAIIIPLAPLEIALSPFLSQVYDHYQKYFSNYEDKYSMRIFEYAPFNENQINLSSYELSFYNYHFEYVFTNSQYSTDLPQVQIHGYKEYDERVQVKIIKCNNNLKDYYANTDIAEIEYDDTLFYLVKPPEMSEIIAFEYNECIIELSFDRISFSEDSMHPLITEIKIIDKIDELLIEINSSELFSDETLSKYIAYINEYC